MKRNAILVAMCVVVAMSLVGCQKAAEKAVEGATGVKVDDDSVTITGAEGEKATVGSAEGSLPDGFPEDFPLHENAEIGESSAVSSGGVSNYSVVVRVDEDVKSVYDWWKSEMADAGYTLESDALIQQGGEDSGVFVGSKDDKHATVTFGAEDGGTLVTIVIQVGG